MVDTHEFCQFVREIYDEEYIPLHRPIFQGEERINLVKCIESNFVSSVGEYVNMFESAFSKSVNSEYAVATVNGTSALHAALYSIGVDQSSEVLTQAVSFVATSNAIKYCCATPVFIDVDQDTLGMSPEKLKSWLNMNCISVNGKAINRNSRKPIKACVPMHTFGFPCRIQEIQAICAAFDIPVVEDSAESLGSYVGNQHTGTFGLIGTFSFNGNKIITTGGGGMLVTNSTQIADRLKHLTTTAKIPHAYEYYHNEVGFNYRLPNINAAIGVAQLEMLSFILEQKNNVAKKYQRFFSNSSAKLVTAIEGATSNNWLNTIILRDRNERDAFLSETNKNGIMTRPIWNLLAELPMFANCEHDGLANSRWLVERTVNIPSSAPGA